MPDRGRVNRAWFYAHRRVKQVQVTREAQEQAVCQAIERCRERWKSYGYRRVTAALRREGLRLNHKRVWRLMHQHGWGCRRVHKRICTTRKGQGRYLPNVLRDRAASAPNQIWVTDITYIRLPGHFVYLAPLLDAFSRVCVGWQLSEPLDDQIVLDAFEQAYQRRAPTAGLIVHSDRGSQYSSHAFQARLRLAQAQGSMSRAGNPYDNAFAESFFSLIKREEVYQQRYEDLDQARSHLTQFLVTYNTSRLHSSLDYQSPLEFEAAFWAAHGM